MRDWKKAPLDDWTKDRVLYWIKNTNEKDVAKRYRDQFSNISQFVTDQIERHENEAVFLSDAQILFLKKTYQNIERGKEYLARYGNSFKSDTDFLGRKFNAFRG